MGRAVGDIKSYRVFRRDVMLFGVWKWWKMCPMELTHENVTYFEFFFFFFLPFYIN